MADYDLKSITPSATVTDGTTIMFGAEGQTATPQPYTTAGIWTWIVAKITANAAAVKTALSLTKTDVGLGSVSNNAQLTIANNLSDLASAATARANLGFNQSPRIGYQNGNWYIPDGQNFGSNNSVSLNTIRFSPLPIRQACHVTDIGVNVVGAVASSNIQLGLYASDPTTGKPTGAVLSSTPNVSTAATGRISGTLASSVAVSPGLYWIGINADTGTQTLTTMATGPSVLSTDVGDTTLAAVWGGSTLVTNGYGQTSVTFGTWPSVGTISALATAFFTAFKVSVP